LAELKGLAPVAEWAFQTAAWRVECWVALLVARKAACLVAWMVGHSADSTGQRWAEMKAGDLAAHSAVTKVEWTAVHWAEWSGQNSAVNSAEHWAGSLVGLTDAHSVANWAGD